MYLLGASLEGTVGIGDQVWEVGMSFSTEPSLAIWKVKIPWLAVGYRFGDLFEGCG